MYIYIKKNPKFNSASINYHGHNPESSFKIRSSQKAVWELPVDSWMDHGGSQRAPQSEATELGTVPTSYPWYCSV